MGHQTHQDLLDINDLITASDSLDGDERDDHVTSSSYSTTYDANAAASASEFVLLPAIIPGIPGIPAIPAIPIIPADSQLPEKVSIVFDPMVEHPSTVFHRLDIAQGLTLCGFTARIAPAKFIHPFCVSLVVDAPSARMLRFDRVMQVTANSDANKILLLDVMVVLDPSRSALRTGEGTCPPPALDLLIVIVKESIMVQDGKLVCHCGKCIVLVPRSTLMMYQDPAICSIQQQIPQIPQIPILEPIPEIPETIPETIPEIPNFPCEKLHVLDDQTDDEICWTRSDPTRVMDAQEAFF